MELTTVTTLVNLRILDLPNTNVSDNTTVNYRTDRAHRGQPEVTILTGKLWVAEPSRP